MKPYSSPNAYLNRYFKKSKRFLYQTDVDGCDYYVNRNYRLMYIEGEKFILEERVIDRDTGADYFEELFYGTLEDCVKIMKENK